ncbi:hypothetical protein [Ruegeria marina]|uniref:Translocase n=1 Tax=Ruegeria marina TaxID=639004 RepID=A0A1G6WP75_9RHOB|nr:hypothetical protein [Ruegeria marina]SDD66896.1 hypothetical protein SAMN04488239_109116 [Ruegeria marina]
MAQKSRKILTAGGTVLCAALIGFLMQQNAAREARQMAPRQSVVQQAVQQPETAIAPEDHAVTRAVGLSLAAASIEMNQPVRLPALALEQASPFLVKGEVLPETPPDPSEPRLGCAVQAVAVPAPMASARLSVSAPCYGNQRVSVHHSGLIFTDTTDDAGNLAVNVPAMSASAVFVVAFQNGRGTVAVTEIEDFDQVARVAIQWSGAPGFQLHAREFGASYGEPGHVWADGDAGGQGQVTRLGQPDSFAPQLAEIYSFPVSDSDRSGSIALSIEAEVTARNCGRDISAQSLELRGDGSLATHDLVFSMPDCSAAGDFLVLNNLVEDLKIAAK